MEAESILEDYTKQLLHKYSRATEQARDEEDELMELASGGGSMIGAVVQSETDLVVAKLSLIIALSKGAEDTGSGFVYLREGLQYIVTPNNQYLVVDPVFCHAAYVRFVNNEERTQPVITGAKQFLMLIKEESYYAGLRPFEKMGNGRPMLFLDLKKLREKSIDTSLITGGVQDGWSHTG
jgi:hypothetical protein